MSKNDTSSSSGSQQELDRQVEESQPYLGEDQIAYNNGEGPKEEQALSRSPTTLERIQSKLSFFNGNLKNERLELARSFLIIYALMGFFVLGIFSIYWGSAYQRFDRLSNLKMLVVVEEDTPINNLPTVGESLINLLNTDEVKAIGNWQIQNITHFAEVAAERNNTIEEEINRQIHHQYYWSSIYVRKNLTYDFYNSLEQGTSFNVTGGIKSIYETGRDFVNMGAYVTPQIEKVERLWLARQSSVVSPLIQNLNDTARSALVSSENNFESITSPFQFEYVDRIPYTDPVLVAPSQVGLIYMIILTFFNVNFFTEVHKKVHSFGLKNSHFMIYRVLASIISYFWLSLMYSLVTLGMQVDFTVAFGKSGFLVYWMLSWVTMWCVGAVNEIMAMLLVLVYPPLMGFWLLFWVIVNISPTFVPLALSPKVFRYGYALPLHNSFEVTKVIFFNTYKGQIGRNMGILAGWCVLNLVTFVLTCKFFQRQMIKKGMMPPTNRQEQQVKEESA